MLVQILVDNRNSWILPYAEELVVLIQENGHQCKLVHKHSEVTKGDILCLLSCEKIFKNLSLNKNNIVVHESDLPEGKGWSPVSWQILEGKNKIPITLFEADEEIDAGQIYAKKDMDLDGSELIEEIRHKQGRITQSLILEFIYNCPRNEAEEQEGIGSFYPRRRPEDSELDPKKNLMEQFNLLRICDNERYPAFFYLNSKKYTLKIFQDE